MLLASATLTFDLLTSKLIGIFLPVLVIIINVLGVEGKSVSIYQLEIIGLLTCLSASQLSDRPTGAQKNTPVFSMAGKNEIT